MPPTKIPDLQYSLRQQGADAALLTNTTEGTLNPNFFYCTGYEGYGIVVIPAQGKPTLYIPLMERDRAQASGLNIQLLKKDTLKTMLRKGKRIGIDFSHTDLTFHQQLRHAMPKKHFVDIHRIMERLRLVKTPQELSHIAKACKISDAVFAETLRNFHKFRTEADVAAFMNAATAARGVVPSFPTIVASGPNAAVPHHQPTAQKLRKGFCVIDFGIKFNGYCSDTTRTVFIGNPTPKDRIWYQLVLQAQHAAIVLAQKDPRCAALHTAAEKMLGKYKKNFIHSLGHGVGLEIHEAPSLSSKSLHTLLDNVPFTIEPGIYFPKKFGIRIEDTLVLKRGKPRLLTIYPKNLISV